MGSHGGCSGCQQLEARRRPRSPPARPAGCELQQNEWTRARPRNALAPGPPGGRPAPGPALPGRQGPGLTPSGAAPAAASGSVPAASRGGEMQISQRFPQRRAAQAQAAASPRCASAGCHRLGPHAQASTAALEALAQARCSLLRAESAEVGAVSLLRAAIGRSSAGER